MQLPEVHELRQGAFSDRLRQWRLTEDNHPIELEGATRNAQVTANVRLRHVENHGRDLITGYIRGARDQMAEAVRAGRMEQVAADDFDQILKKYETKARKDLWLPDFKTEVPSEPSRS